MLSGLFITWTNVLFLSEYLLLLAMYRIVPYVWVTCDTHTKVTDRCYTYLFWLTECTNIFVEATGMRAEYIYYFCSLENDPLFVSSYGVNFPISTKGKTC